MQTPRTPDDRFEGIPDQELTGHIVEFLRR